MTLAAVLLSSTLATPALAQGSAAAPHKCVAFAREALGESVRINSAKHVAAGAAPTAPGQPPMAITLPAHCLVEGVINQRTGAGGKPYGIGFAIALPDDWNGRFLLMGGGGLNGTVAPPTGPVAAGERPALVRGFAVISHDSGHKGAVFDASFKADQRADLDFSEASVRTVTETGKAITQRFYGRKIDHSYMTGCSTGGREGMLAAQRYPELFDGIVVGAPAMRTGNSNLGIAYSQALFNAAGPLGKDGKPLVSEIFTAADRATILKGLLDQCDGLDKLKDGMIMNVAQCKFSPAKLQCKSGKQDGCLSKAQVSAMDKAFAGPKDKAGYALYMAVPYDTGIVDTAGFIPGYLPTGKPGPLGRPNMETTIDLDARINAIRADAGQRLTDTNYWTNLSTYLGHGGKILFYHGVSDPWFSALDTWDYWQRAQAANGKEAWDQASRFYMVPGMGHCGGGNAFDRFDLLSAVVDWVETDKAPEAVTSSRSSAPGETRPMCPFPAFAQHEGGDPKQAASFSCKTPES